MDDLMKLFPAVKLIASNYSAVDSDLCARVLDTTVQSVIVTACRSSTPLIYHEINAILSTIRAALPYSVSLFAHFCCWNETNMSADFWEE
ncbi:hypothetical protein TNIN_271661 [Trichonephila inaurata madagascariensis]|uniref:Uncharacterized protein n=1 Tax=Trichonephila inaurata madagascariensis TaxID=2747483 RepID=A0A8X6K748_9ARAC|nr:hypothetical protein TNIN_271661 [Trichonephila inaurata madagascariensis]